MTNAQRRQALLETITPELLHHLADQADQQNHESDEQWLKNVIDLLLQDLAPMLPDDDEEGEG